MSIPIIKRNLFFLERRTGVFWLIFFLFFVSCRYFFYWVCYISNLLAHFHYVIIDSFFKDSIYAQNFIIKYTNNISPFSNRNSELLYDAYECWWNKPKAIEDKLTDTRVL